LADLDSVWGRGMLNSDMFAQMVYLGLWVASAGCTDGSPRAQWEHDAVVEILRTILVGSPQDGRFAVRGWVCGVGDLADRVPSCGKQKAVPTNSIACCATANPAPSGLSSGQAGAAPVKTITRPENCGRWS